MAILDKEVAVHVPSCILVEYVMPFVDDRQTWNNLSIACRYIRGVSTRAAERPWPKQLSLPKASHHFMISSVAFSPNGHYIACGSISQIDIWDRVRGHVLQLRHPIKGCVKSISFSLDGRHIGASATDSNPIIWDLTTRECRQIALFESGGGRAKELRFIENENDDSSETIICASSQGIWKFDLKTGLCRQVFSLGVARWYTHVLAIDTANGHWLATSEDHAGLVTLLNNHSGARVVIRHNADFVSDVAFSPSFVATGGDHGIVQIWDRRHGELVERLYGLVANVTSIAFHPDGLSLAAADDTGRLLVSSRSGEFCTQTASRSINKVVFTPDGSMLVAAGNDGKLSFWSRSTWDSSDCRSCSL
jgi:WD40 repeat protein